MDTLLAELNIVLQEYYHTTLAYVPRIGIALIILTLGFLIASFVTSWVGKKLKLKSKDQITASVLTRAAKMLLYVGVVLVGLHAAGLSGIATALFGALGASTLVLGFAFKDIGENFLAGVILAFSRPFNVGDAIEVDGYFGVVKALAFRYTQLKTFDGKDVYVPNGDVLNNSVTNYTEDGFIRQDFIIGIAYEDDIDAAIAVVKHTADSFAGIIDTETHNTFACVDELATSTVNIKVRFWIETMNYRRVAMETRGMLMRAVKEALNEKGFGMPADITELKLYGSETSIPVEIVDARKAPVA